MLWKAKVVWLPFDHLAEWMEIDSVAWDDVVVIFKIVWGFWVHSNEMLEFLLEVCVVARF